MLIRFSLGLLAAALFAGSSTFGPSFAVDSVTSFWPAQSDAFALTFGLLGLISLSRHLRNRTRSSLVISMIAFCFAVWFKEIAFVAIAVGIGLTLQGSALSRREKALGAFSLALGGLILWVMRLAVLGGTSAYSPPTDLIRAFAPVIPIGMRTTLDVGWPEWSALLFLVSMAVARIRLPSGNAPVIIGAAAGLSAACLLAGSPGLFFIEQSWQALWSGLVYWLGAAGVAAALRKCPVIRPVVLAWLLALYIVSPFKLTMGWYRYWPEALGAAVQVLALPFSLSLLAWLLGVRITLPRGPSLSNAARPAPLPMLWRIGLACAAGLSICAVAALGSTYDGTLLSTTDKRLVRGVPLTITRIVLSREPDGRQPLIVLPGSSYPAFWDRRDPRTSVARGLARLGYDVHIVRAEEWRSPTTRKAIRSWIENSRWRRGSVAIFSWSDGAPAGVDLAAAPPTTPRMSSAAAFVGPEHIEEVSAGIRQIVNSPGDGPPVYAAVAKQDLPALRRETGEIPRSFEGRRNRLQLYVPYNDGPVFPEEPNHWKRSLDMGIEHLVIHAPP